MPPSIRKGILILLLIAILTIAVAFIPNILSDDLGAWCKERWGENYKYFLVAILPFCAVALVLLTTDLGKYFLPGAGKKTTDRFNIPPGPKSRQILIQAKAAIASAEQGEALRLLSDLKLSALDTEIDLLSSRLVDYQRTRIHGVEAQDTENRTFNRITRDTRDLITTLEKELTTGTKDFDTIRDYLKKRYNNRIDQKLAKRQPVNLRRIPSIEGTSQERVATFVAYNSEEIGGTMADIFREGRSRLLLLGAPGAGKTTLMIQLVLELLDSDQDSMPVLLNLATWSKEFITLEAWLKKILPAELGVNDRFASEIILQNRLILLLDGFDEIKEKGRESCIEAIKRYSEDNTRQYAISSRIEEYKQITKDAPVESQIEVGPLSLGQLQKELQRLWSHPVSPERGARLLWNAIQENDLLQKVVETPFYFNSLQIMFSGSNTWAELQIKADSVEKMKDQITARFVEYELDGAREKCPADKSTHWLSFLSSRMNQRNMVAFELIDLQYDWWGKWSKSQIKSGFLLESCVFGFAPALVIALLCGHLSIILSISFSTALNRDELLKLMSTFPTFISDGQINNELLFLLTFLLGFIFTLMFLSITSLFHSYTQYPDIIPFSRGQWSWKNFIEFIKRHHKNVLYFGLGLGFVLGIYFGILAGFSFNPGVGLLITLFTIPLLGLVSMLLFSLIAVVYFFNIINILQINTPYQRFTNSMKNLNFSILQHKYLCYQMRNKGLLPKNLVQFLNEMSRRHILEFDGNLETGTEGGTWRFRHRILQEYFAEKWVEPEYDQ